MRSLIGLASLALVGLAIFGVWRLNEQRKFNAERTAIQEEAAALQSAASDIRAKAVKHQALADFLRKVCAEGIQTEIAQNAELLKECDAAQVTWAGLKATAAKVTYPAWGDLKALRSDVDVAQAELAKLHARERDSARSLVDRGIEEARLRYGQIQTAAGAIVQGMPSPPESVADGDAVLDYLHRVVNVLYDLRVAEREMGKRRQLPSDVAEVIGPGSRRGR